MQALCNTRKVNKGIVSILLAILFCAMAPVYAGTDPEIVTRFKGRDHEIAVTNPFAWRETIDPIFYDPQHYTEIDNPANDKYLNTISLFVDEDDRKYIPADFMVTVTVEITWTDKDGNLQGPIQKDLQVDYKIAEGTKYDARNYYWFDNARKVKVTIIAVNKHGASWDVTEVLTLENRMQVKRDYIFNSSSTATNLQAVPGDMTPENKFDELVLSWNHLLFKGITHYDVEWTWVDMDALDRYKSGNPLNFDAMLLFRNNATRVTISSETNSYKVPLIYDGPGYLFYRVRPLQYRESGEIKEGEWSASGYNGITWYNFTSGHEPALNWQVSTTYAEEGKRKTVISYFDGTLRSRQTVTKDNVNNNTVVAETWYDYQGRPAINILPAPTLSKVIEYAVGFNRFTSTSHPKDVYDLVPVGQTICTMNTPPLDNNYGSAKYYSPNNPKVNEGTNKYIPDAEGFPYSETRYTPDATGRIATQGGVGTDYQIGDGKHATKYFYGYADQRELNALFGTEVGEQSHYFKNMVRDANGQYSVSYVDMQGRTIATALAGEPPANMQPLSSYAAQTMTRNLLGKNNNIVKGRSIESATTLLVTKAGLHSFHYELNPQSAEIAACNPEGQVVCYDCYYDLEIRITGTCGQTPVVITRRNFTFGSYDVNCGTPPPTLVVDENLTLEEGEYNITKTLRLSKDAQDWYKENLFSQKNICKSLQQFYDETYQVMMAANTCAMTCATCTTVLGSPAQYRTRFLQSIGVNPATTVPYENEITASYNEAKANCDALCNDPEYKITLLRRQLLQDMTPDMGQYAKGDVDLNGNGIAGEPGVVVYPPDDPNYENPEWELNTNRKYNIFNTSPPYFGYRPGTIYTPFYKYPKDEKDNSTWYKNEMRVRDESINTTASGTSLLPLRNYTPDQFIPVFKDTSWASSLIYYHPEYCKLKTIESNLSLVNSFNWDINLEKTDTWANALTAEPGGYIYSSNLLNKDPYFNMAGNSSMKSIMTGLVNGNFRSGKSMWQIALSVVKCDNPDDPSCINSIPAYPTSTNNFDAGLCTSDKNNVWKIFRSIYLSVKDSLFNLYLDQQCPGINYTELKTLGYQRRFGHIGDYYSMQIANIISNSSNPEAEAEIQLLPTYTSTCESYINMWEQQLLNCDVLAARQDKQQILDAITSQMRQVCIWGSNVDHPYGSSTLAPGDPRTPNSFESVISAVFSTYGIPVSVVCHPYLVDYPQPYDKQIPAGDAVIVKQRDECVCGRLTELQNEKVQTSYPGTLSQFIQYQHGIFIRQTFLDTLLAGCQSSCKTYDPPLSIPAILNCTTPLKNCITCDEYTTLRTTFRSLYPAFVVPYREPQTEDEVNRNKMFELFMNNRTGFRKSIVEYIQFEVACENFNQNWTCARLDSIVTAFHITYPNAGYGEGCQQLFTNYFNQAFGTYYTYTGIDALYKQYCAAALLVCQPTLNCSGYKQVISDFYQAYGSTIFSNPNCQSLFTGYFNGRFQTSYTWSGLESLYTSLCGGTLDVCTPFSAVRLQQAMNDWRNQHPLAWADNTCMTQWVNFFNGWFQSNLAEWQIAALYNGVGIIYSPCQPPIQCATLQQMITMYNNLGTTACDSSGLNPSSPTYCNDCFSWFINHKLNTAYSFEQISLMYLRSCGVTLPLCQGQYSCQQLTAVADSFMVSYQGTPANCQNEFAIFYNQYFGTSLSYTQVMAVYQLYCGQQPSLCGKVPITSCQQLTDVKNNFLAIYPNPGGYFGLNCQTAFADYFNQAFGDTLSFPSIDLYYINLCGQALNICDTSGCQILRDFLVGYHQQYDTVSLPQSLCRDLYTKLLNDHLQSLSGGGKEGPPPVFYTWQQFAAMYQNCGINLNVCGVNGPVVSCNNIKGAKQVFYILYPSALSGDNCSQLFVEFFNLYFNTNFTSYSNLEQWVAQLCNGYILNVCGSGGSSGGSVGLEIPAASGNPPTAPRLCESTGMFPTIDESNDPCEFIKTLALNAATEQYNIYISTKKDDFDKRHNEKCLAAGPLEIFTVTSAVAEYHYTLYYYDQAGQLVKTVPPAGVAADFSNTFYNAVETARQNVLNGQPLASNVVVPNHTLLTEYRYNTLGQVVQQKSPDGGLSKFWYDALGRLVVSQNQKQASGNKYSYTKYDVLGRITEVGQLTSGSAITQTTTQDDGLLSGWINNAASSREQITITKYDEPKTELCVPAPAILCQQNLRNRVSYSYVQPTASFNNNNLPYSSATYYTYDLHGNVDVLLQHYNDGIMQTVAGNAFKRLEYKYDLISGKVNEVAYQPGVKDQYYHRYSYDAENKLTKVETSHDYVYWQQQAAYSYYRHGPLARTETGQLTVQGIDYVYALQGWLKGVNSTSTGTGFDVGGDNTNGIRPARDAYGFSLNYNTTDYKSINNTVTPFVAGTFNLVNTDATTVAKPLFNGNIAAMMVNIPKLGDANLYGYKYDQLNRIMSMDAFNGFNNANNTWTNGSATAVSNYKERVSYDGNGNILTYLRNGTTANSNQLAMDNLTYNYITNSNKLSSVNDVVAAGNYTMDIDNQAAGNYEYDDIGNLTKDNAEGITSIEWTVYGKIKTINKSGGVTICYTYDASGNRISKQIGTKATFYVRDASGNVMAIYENGNAEINAGKLSQVEVHLYGSSRLGLWQRNLDVESTNWWLFQRTAMAGSTNGGTMTVFARGKTTYEMSNHLGNVLVTVSDRKVQVQDPNNTTQTLYYTADVVTATDFYPFGLDMPARTFGTSARYGFNGKERDKDMHSLTAYDYGFRIYNPAIGKFLSVDPLTGSYPWYTPYQFAGNMPIYAIDLDGLEEKPAIQPIEIRLKPIVDNTGRKPYIQLPPELPKVPSFKGGIKITDAQPGHDNKTMFDGNYSSLQKWDKSGLSGKLVTELAGTNIGDINSCLQINAIGVVDRVSKSWKGTDYNKYQQYSFSLNTENLSVNGTFEIQVASIKMTRPWDPFVFIVMGKVFTSIYIRLAPIVRASANIVKEELVTLYRSISLAEAESIQATKQLAFKEGQLEVKQFWQSKEGLDNFNKTVMAGQYNLEIQVPKSILGAGKPLNTTTQVDEALGLNATIDGAAQLKAVNESIKTIKITPIKL